MSQLNSIHDYYDLGDGLSGMDEEVSILQNGRYGGVGFMWQKNIALNCTNCKNIQNQSKRLCGLIMTLANKRRLWNLPCDTYRCVNADLVYVKLLMKDV